jgi:hypothetical protein
MGFLLGVFATLATELIYLQHLLQAGVATVEQLVTVAGTQFRTLAAEFSWPIL